MRLTRELRSRLQYKIILPFLLLTLLVALAGAAVALTLVTSSLQDRFDNQLAQVARGASDSVVRQEQANLQFLREVAFAPANPDTGTLAVASALAANDSAALADALDPYFRSGVLREDLKLDRLIVFDRSGVVLIDWEQGAAQPPASAAQGEGEVARVSHSGTNIQQQWFVQSVLQGTSDETGDKFAGLLTFQSGGSYLFSVAPVQENGEIVGGVLAARRLDTLLRALQSRSQADIVAIYEPSGKPLASTFEPVAGLAALAIEPGQAEQLIKSQADANLPEEQRVESVYTVPVNQRDYQFAYSVLKVRGSVVGLISAALARDYVVGPWSTATWPILVTTLGLMLAIITLGVYVARSITRPLEELVATAEAVTAGDFQRRSSVTVEDEVGQLSDSFNTMTDYLLRMYGSVQAEASRSVAIVESIADGVVVCDSEGRILVANPAARQLVAQAGQGELPARFEELPLLPIGEQESPFGGKNLAELRAIGGRIVRLNVAPVMVGEARLGDVYLLQDLTDEAAIDRARTNFIATISHELRTPLTVLRGYADLMLRGLVGKLSDEQSQMIDSMRGQVNHMTGLINNVIVIANLDSGSLSTVLEPHALKTIVDEALWQMRGQISAKGLEMRVELPEALPLVLADRDQLRQVLVHLLDNARRYTSDGSITVQAKASASMVQVDVHDTGCGIAPELRRQIFDRFIRGDEGINSPERGIGLGLAIVKQLVERHNGTVWVTSEIGRGSTFSFTLQQSNGPTNHDTGDHSTPYAHAA
jgi:signal transduction histidine kinase/HAMP domain-containing protein